MKRRRAKKRRAATTVASDRERKRSGRPKAIDSQDVKRAKLHVGDLGFKPALDKTKTAEQPIDQHGVVCEDAEIPSQLTGTSPPLTSLLSRRLHPRGLYVMGCN